VIELFGTEVAPTVRKDFGHWSASSTGEPAALRCHIRAYTADNSASFPKKTTYGRWYGPLTLDARAVKLVTNTATRH
jgi:hypothetical protein